MANEVVNRQVNIYISSGDAQKTYDALIKKQDQLKASLQEATDPKQITKLNDQLAKLEEPIDRAAKKVSGELDPSLKDLSATVGKLSAEIKLLSKQDEGYTQKISQLKEATSAYDAQKTSISGLRTEQDNIFGSFGKTAVRVGELVGLYNVAETAFDKVVEFGKGIIEETLESELATKQLKAALDSLGRGDAFASLEKSAEDLHQQFVRFKPEDFLKIFTGLVTNSKLSENQILQLTPVIVDLNARQRALGETNATLADSTKLVTLALEGNSRGLKTYGINIKDGATPLERFNILMTDLKTKVEGSELAFENTKSGGFENFKTKIAELQKTLGQAIENLLGLGKNANELFDDAKAKTEEYEASLHPLLERYDELKSKTTLNKNEQDELRGIIQKIASIVPDAVTQFNQYGEALDINKDKVKSFLAINKQILAEKEFKAVEENLDAIKKSLKDIDGIQRELNTGSRVVGTGPGGFSQVGLTDEDKKESLSEIRALQIQAVQTADLLKQKYGKDLPDALQKAVDSIKSVITATDKIKPTIKNGDNPFDYTSVVESLKKRQQQVSDLSKTDYQKQIEAANKFYNELAAQAVGNAALLKQIETTRQQELAALRAKFLASQLKELKDYSKGFTDILDKIYSFNNKSLTIDVKPLERDLQEAFNEYSKLFVELRDLRDRDLQDIEERRKKGEITRTQANAAILQVDTKFQEDSLALNNAYQNNKQAIIDKYAKEEIQKERDKNDKLIAEHQRFESQIVRELKKLADTQAQTQLLTAQANNNGSLKSRLAELQAEENLEKQHARDTITNEEQLQAALDAIDKKYDVKRIKTTADYFKQYVDLALKAISDISNFLDQQDQRELDAAQAKSDQKKKTLDDELAAKVLSQKQYNREVAKNDKELADKQHKIKVEEFKRQKALDVAKAIINTASAVVEVLPNYVLAAIVAATGLLEIGLIEAQKPPEYAVGGKLQGPSHKEGGIPVYSKKNRRQIAEAEGDEMITKKSVSYDRNNYTIKGTPSQIISTLNGMHGGARWDTNATIYPSWKDAPVPAMNYGYIQNSYNKVRLFDKGGVVNSNATTASASQSQQPIVIQGGFNDQQFTQLMNAFDKKLKAEVILRDLNLQQDRLNNVTDNATLK